MRIERFKDRLAEQLQAQPEVESVGDWEQPQVSNPVVGGVDGTEFELMIVRTSETTGTPEDVVTREVDTPIKVTRRGQNGRSLPQPADPG